MKRARARGAGGKSGAPSGRSRLPETAAVVLIAFNLRGAVVAVAPLLGSIRSSTGMSAAVAGILTSIPVLCFGLGALVAPRVARRFGIEATLAAALGILTVGSLARLATPVSALLGGTVLVGAAIAAGNVLLPALVKRDFPQKLGAITAGYVTSLSIGSVLAAGGTVPLRHLAGTGWRPALAVWAIPGLLAAATAVTRLGRRRRRSTPSGPLRAVRGLHRDPLAWQVTGYMGMQSFSFYATTSWLPSLFSDHGISASGAGWLLAISSLASLPTALAVPILAGRRRTQWHLMGLTAAVWLVALLGLLFAPTAVAPLWMVLLGLAQGSSLGLALTLIVLRSPDSEHAAQLSSMAQGVGYLVAATGPLAFGVLHDVLGGWTASLGMLVILMLPQLGLGLGASRDLRIGGRAPAAPLA